MNLRDDPLLMNLKVHGWSVDEVDHQWLVVWRLVAWVTHCRLKNLMEDFRSE